MSLLRFEWGKDDVDGEIHAGVCGFDLVSERPHAVPLGNLKFSDGRNKGAPVLAMGHRAIQNMDDDAGRSWCLFKKVRWGDDVPAIDAHAPEIFEASGHHFFKCLTASDDYCRAAGDVVLGLEFRGDGLNK